MTQNRLHISCLVALIFLLLALHSDAQWSTDPSNNLIVGYGQAPQIASDSAGGCYIAYVPELTYPFTTRLLRLNRHGYNVWTNYIVIRGELPSAAVVKLVADGNGGAIVAYESQFVQDYPTMVFKSRSQVQRIDSNGNLVWGSAGVRVSLSEANQIRLTVVPDGHAGCIVAWEDTLHDLRINRIDSSGRRAWGDSGFSAGSTQENPQLVDDGRGGCIIRARSGVLQRYDPSGIPLWGTGTLVDIGSAIVSEEAGGLMLAGMRFLSYNNGDPYWRAECQRIDSLGNTAWGSSGIILMDSVQSVVLNPPGIILERNLTGGATFAWGKRVASGVMNAFAQRVHRDGSLVWDSILRVNWLDSVRSGPWKIISSLSDSKIFINDDSRNGGSTYAQRIDTTGMRLWDSLDVPVSIPGLGSVSAVSDGTGGFIVVGLGGGFSIRAQQVSVNGKLGEVMATVKNPPETIPDNVWLDQNFPNPFNPVTVIRYTLSVNGYVSLKVYDVLGREVATLVNEVKQPGQYTIRWNAVDQPSGVYFYRLTARKFVSTRKMILMR